VVNAEIIIHKNEKENVPIAVQYNPSEYSMGMAVNYQRVRSGNKSKGQFTGIPPKTLSFKLVIDGFNETEEKARDVSKEVEKLQTLVKISAEKHGPPECTFKWGVNIVKGFVEKLTVRYTMFTSKGKPVRAHIDLTIVENKDGKTAKESPDRTKRRVLTQNTELYMVANDVYEDPTAWRQIATANGLNNPRILEPGMALRIPPLAEDK